MKVRCPYCVALLEVPGDATTVRCGRCRERFAMPESFRDAVPGDESTAAGAWSGVDREPSSMTRVPSDVLRENPADDAGAAPGPDARAEPVEEPPARASSSVRVAPPRRTIPSTASYEGESPSSGDSGTALERVRREFREKFDEVEALGCGGMGALYRAKQKRPARLVVLKIMLGGQFAGERYRRRFEREVMAVARLKHANVVSVYEYGEVSGQPYFTMEYVNGCSIKEYCAQEGLKKLEVCKLMQAVANAVAYAHQRGVIHRDLKPSNIMVDTDGRPRVLDFGLAQLHGEDGEILNRMTESGEVMGTPSYMSPEQAAGRPWEIDVRTDVYSLGIVLYELLTGQLPYEVDRSRPLEGMRAVRETPPKRPSTIMPSIDADLEAILMKSLEKRKDLRYAGAAALADDLQRYVEGSPVMARPATTFYYVRKLIWRHRVGVASFAAAVVAAAVITAVVMLNLVESGRRAESGRRRAEVRADEAVQKEEELRRRERELVDLLDDAEGVKNKVAALLGEGRWEYALSLAEAAAEHRPDSAEFAGLVAHVEQRTVAGIDEKVHEVRRMVGATDYVRAREGLVELRDLAGRLRVAAAKARIKAMSDSFDLLCWQTARGVAERGDGGIKALSDFLSECPNSPYRKDALAELKGLTTSVCFTAWPFGDSEARRRRDQTARLFGLPGEAKIDLAEGVQLPLRLVPAGRFVMGSTASEPGGTTNERPAHDVVIPTAFYVGSTEVTVAQYRSVMDPQAELPEDGLPMSGVTWEGAAEFCRRLSERTGLRVRLPYEAEWEFVCRGGSDDRFSFDAAGGDVNDHFWHAGNAPGGPAPVGAKMPNALGLYDLHGNVAEWCADWYDGDFYAQAAADDIDGPSDGRYRVLRGGSWSSPAGRARSAARDGDVPDRPRDDVGFRVCVDILPRGAETPTLRAVSMLALE